MLIIDKAGLIAHPRVKVNVVPGLAKGRMGVVHGIVVHQTGGSTAEAAFAGYRLRPFGTHLLIDKDGTIYQTASLLYYTEHVGKLKARCLAEHRCTPVEMKRYGPFNPTLQSQLEKKKAWPARYPMSMDSVGIELVGEFQKAKGVYVETTKQQNDALAWLVKELAAALQVPMQEVFRHPDLSWKQPSEALSAQW